MKNKITALGEELAKSCLDIINERCEKEGLSERSSNDVLESVADALSDEYNAAADRMDNENGY